MKEYNKSYIQDKNNRGVQVFGALQPAQTPVHYKQMVGLQLPLYFLASTDKKTLSP